jgi:hypothetical protein
MGIENTKRIEEVELGDDDERYPCGYCDVGLLSGSTAVNHYLDAHGFRLLAVAPQSHWASDGRQVWNKIIAVLGHDSPPAKIRREALVVELENLMEDGTTRDA